MLEIKRYKCRVKVQLQGGNILEEDRFYMRRDSMEALDAVEQDCEECKDRLIGVQVYAEVHGRIGAWELRPRITKGPVIAHNPQSNHSDRYSTTPLLADILADAPWAWYAEAGPTTFPTLKPKSSHVLSRSVSK